MSAVRRRLEQLTEGAATPPLLLLFVLNLVDEFDQWRRRFAPRDRDTFASEA